MQRDRAELLLREPNLYKAILVLALPVFGANFMKAFNELVDTFFIGQIADSVLAQAAVSMTWPCLLYTSRADPRPHRRRREGTGDQFGYVDGVGLHPLLQGGMDQ